MVTQYLNNPQFKLRLFLGFFIYSLPYFSRQVSQLISQIRLIRVLCLQGGAQVFDFLPIYFNILLAGRASKALIILLRDEPIRWFLSYFDNRWSKLSDFGENEKSYGRIHTVQMNGKSYGILPLVHPRQATRLGAHSKRWAGLHSKWIEKKFNGNKNLGA